MKGAIFDLDGTLLNTIGVITKALNKALVDFGFETYEEEDVKSKVGYGPRRLIEDSVPNIDAELREKIYKNNRKYSDELTYDSAMFDDIDKLLDEEPVKKTSKPNINKPNIIHDDEDDIYSDL